MLFCSVSIWVLYIDLYMIIFMWELPLVSILICAYNAEKFLIPTLESVLQQTYKNIEVLIVDNASTDNTYWLHKKINDSRVKRFKSDKNLGPYKGLNYLLDRAKWDYIAIQDHDDFWHPEKIDKQVKFLQKNKKYIGCWTKTLMYYQSDQKWFEYCLWEENYYTLHPSLVFRNQWQRYPEDRVYMNDAYFQKKVLCHWKKIIYNINQTLTVHYIKNWAQNYSYKRFSYTQKNIRTLFSLHTRRYAMAIFLWEWIRKVGYPTLLLLWKSNWIDYLEKMPFILQWYKINIYNNIKLREFKIYM